MNSRHIWYVCMCGWGPATISTSSSLLSVLHACSVASEVDWRVSLPVMSNSYLHQSLFYYTQMETRYHSYGPLSHLTVQYMSASLSLCVSVSLAEEHNVREDRPFFFTLLSPSSPLPSSPLFPTLLLHSYPPLVSSLLPSLYSSLLFSSSTPPLLSTSLYHSLLFPSYSTLLPISFSLVFKLPVLQGRRQNHLFG